MDGNTIERCMVDFHADAVKKRTVMLKCEGDRELLTAS